MVLRAILAAGLFGAAVAPASASDEYVVINLSANTGSSEAYAFGINANGWIVGSGENGSDTVAFLLIPIDDYKANWCPADIANPTAQCPNGVVDVSDLLALLANWSTNGPGADIAAPTNVVDVFDLLSAWGDCPPCITPG